MSTPTDLISLVDAAHQAGVVTSTIYRWASRGKIALFKRGHNTLVRRADVARVLQPHRLPTPKKGARGRVTAAR